MRITIRYFFITLTGLFWVSCNESATQKQKTELIIKKRDIITRASIPQKKKKISENLMNDLEKENLKGRVKCITEHCYYAKEKNGKLVKAKLWFWIIYYYDSLGNELWESQYAGDGWYKGDTLNKAYSYKYSGKGIILEKYENSGGLTADSIDCYNIETYIYDKKGWLIKEYGHSPYASIDSKSLYKYDTSGNLIEQHYYHSEDTNKEVEREVYKYDNNGNKIERLYFNDDEKRNNKSTYKYDDNGNEIEYCGYDSIEISNRSTKKYDSKNNQTECTIYEPNGTIQSTTKYRYEYDSVGNWVREIDTTLFVKYPMILTERVIEYYK